MMEANFGGLMNFLTVRFQPSLDLTTDEQLRLVQCLIKDGLEKGTFRADQCAILSNYLKDAAWRFHEEAVLKRSSGKCNYCGANDHIEADCVHLKRAHQRGETIL